MNSYYILGSSAASSMTDCQYQGLLRAEVIAMASDVFVSSKNIHPIHELFFVILVFLKLFCSS